jgi:hypothetical protein
MQNAPMTHALPQNAQLLFVPSGVSQPSVCLLPLQSWKPVWHAPLQEPEPHVGVGMWFGEHVVPHPPQLLGSALRLTSHPLFCLLPSQSWKPVAQVPLQTLELHVGVGMLLGEHVVPHPPQLLGLLVGLTSQPSFDCPLQFMYGGVHEPMVHWLLTQAGVPFCVVHALLQAPQLFTLLATLTSQPSLVCPLQFKKPGLHEPMVHWLLTQAGVPFAVLHTLLQAPQLFTLLTT